MLVINHKNPAFLMYIYVKKNFEVIIFEKRQEATQIQLLIKGSNIKLIIMKSYLLWG